MSSHLDFKLNKEQQAFCAEHVRLAYSEAHKFSRRTGIPYDDLIGAAHIGLAKGAHRFDPAMGYKPSTYLVSLIRGELLHHAVAEEEQPSRAERAAERFRAPPAQRTARRALPLHREQRLARRVARAAVAADGHERARRRRKCARWSLGPASSPSQP